MLLVIHNDLGSSTSSLESKELSGSKTFYQTSRDYNRLTGSWGNSRWMYDIWVTRIYDALGNSWRL